MKNNLKIGFCAIAIFIMLLNVAYASDVQLCADSEFAYAFASLSSSKSVTFSCTTYDEKGYIRITACWLQHKVGENWEGASSLSVPDVLRENTNTYGAYMDYSSAIGKGTFRIAFTVEADGHAITRYSNERTY